MTAALFTCPQTSEKVQYWLDDDQDLSNSEYEAVTCNSCSKIHFINRKTGKLFGEDES